VAIAVSKDIGSRKKQNLIMVIVFTPTEYVKLKTGTGVEKNSFYIFPFTIFRTVLAERLYLMQY